MRLKKNVTMSNTEDKQEDVSPLNMKLEKIEKDNESKRSVLGFKKEEDRK